MPIGRGHAPSFVDLGCRLSVDDDRRRGEDEPDPTAWLPQHPQLSPHPGTKSLIPPPLARSEEDPRPNWPPLVCSRQSVDLSSV